MYTLSNPKLFSRMFNLYISLKKIFLTLIFLNGHPRTQIAIGRGFLGEISSVFLVEEIGKLFRAFQGAKLQTYSTDQQDSFPMTQSFAFASTVYAHIYSIFSPQSAIPT
jgi:hypothetical protein